MALFNSPSSPENRATEPKDKKTPQRWEQQQITPGHVPPGRQGPGPREPGVRTCNCLSSMRTASPGSPCSLPLQSGLPWKPGKKNCSWPPPTQPLVQQEPCPKLSEHVCASVHSTTTSGTLAVCGALCSAWRRDSGRRRGSGRTDMLAGPHRARRQQDSKHVARATEQSPCGGSWDEVAACSTCGGGKGGAKVKREVGPSLASPRDRTPARVGEVGRVQAGGLCCSLTRKALDEPSAHPCTPQLRQPPLLFLLRKLSK